MTTEEKILSNAKSVEEWILGGLPEREVSAALGIGYSTFRKAKRENNLIRDLVNGASQRYKKEQEKIQSEKIAQVRGSLFQRCLGYDVDMPKHYKVKRVARDADGEVLLDAGGKPIMEDALEQVMLLEIRRLTAFLQDKEEDFVKLLMAKTLEVAERESARREEELRANLARSNPRSGCRAGEVWAVLRQMDPSAVIPLLLCCSDGPDGRRQPPS